MPVNPVSAVMAGLQIIKFVTKQIERRELGEMTDEQLSAEWAKMGLDVTEANELWEASAQ